MNHSVCIIDDKIPASNFPEFIDDTKIIDQSVLKYLSLEEGIWDEPLLNNLVKRIFSEQKDWAISAFTTPEFYFNHHDNQLYSPDIIIFDWDFGIPGDTGDYLLELLEKSYAFINIYTQADKRSEVTALIQSDVFKKYSDRLGLVHKGESESISELFDEINKKSDSNFSFRYGRELKKNSVQAIDNILIKISKLSISEFIKLFGTKNNDKFIISTSELTSIISEKFKHELLGTTFSNKVLKTKVISSSEDDAVVKKLWNYRLYYAPTDNIVRKGDIISRKKTNDDKLFLILSSDCHLDAFWKKNFGYLTVAPLYKLKNGNDDIKNLFSVYKGKKLNRFQFTSLTNASNVNGITILPCIRDSKGELNDYLLNAKEVFSFKVPAPNTKENKDDKAKKSLKYGYLKNYNWRNRVGISEPFLSPLIQFILDNVTGYGCPDFPDSLQTIIKKSFNEARK